jgi:hypothetical protein
LTFLKKYHRIQIQYFKQRVYGAGQKVLFYKGGTKMDEVRQIPLLTLAELLAIQEKETFLLVQTSDVTITPGHLRVEIADNPSVAVNKLSRKVIEASSNTDWRWPAGGAAMIVELSDGQQVLLALHRDKGAPSYPDCDTIGSGLGGSIEEICYPLRTALREGVEEVFLKTPTGLVCPCLEQDHFGFDLALEEIVRSGSRLFSELSSVPLYEVKASLIDTPFTQEVKVVWRGKERICQALVCLDRKTRGIDVLTILHLKLDCKLGDLIVLDGEVVGNKPINRVVNAYELEGFKPTGKIVASWQSGKHQGAVEGVYPYKTTPVLQVVDEALRKM